MTNDHPKPDIRLLGERDLPETKFPAETDRFRVFLDPTVHAEIQKHAQRNLAVEIGGILVGGWERDAGGPFVAVRHVICSELAASGAGEVTFTHDAWAEIHRIMDADHADSSIVGWYHTHPDFGVFLSERDQFIHEHFFSDPGQIAYVVDPVRNHEGVFIWQEGKTMLCPHYWVGDEIRTAPPRPEVRHDWSTADTTELSDPTPARSRPMRSDWLLIALLGILFLLIGYLLADRKTRWEQERIVDGVVAHFGTMNVLQPGLRENLALVVQEMEGLRSDLGNIQSGQAGGTATLTRAELDGWRRRLQQIQDALEDIKAVYGFNELESAALAKFLGEEFARSRGGLGSPLPSSERATPTRPQPPVPAASQPSDPTATPPPSPPQPTESPNPASTEPHANESN